MIGLILLAVGMSTLIAFLISFGFYFIAPNIAFAIFWITLGVEWVIMEPINRLLRKKSIKEEGLTFAKMTKYEDSVGKQSVALECEYCSEANAVKVDLNGKNSFICKKCGNGNNVVMQFTTVRTTNPLDTIDVDEVDTDTSKELEDALDEARK